MSEKLLFAVVLAVIVGVTLLAGMAMAGMF